MTIHKPSEDIIGTLGGSSLTGAARRLFIARYKVLRESGDRRRPCRPRRSAPLTRARVQGWISGFGAPADPWPSLVE